MKYIKLLAIAGFYTITSAASAQTKVGDEWVDNNLVLDITLDNIKTNGVFEFCIKDTLGGTCIQNLVTGIEVTVFNNADEILWKGIASGRTKKLKLIAAMPDAHYMVLQAFKPWVTNKSSGNLIHQDERLRLKYFVK
tara:strand:- start:122 stop:532 length:411 start_codon:yes stop_codon:yes gene_type:complete